MSITDIISIIAVSVSSALTIFTFIFTLVVSNKDKRQRNKIEICNELRTLLYVSFPNSIMSLIKSQDKEECVYKFMEIKDKIQFQLGIVYFDNKKIYNEIDSLLIHLEELCISYVDTNDATITSKIEKNVSECKKNVNKYFK